MDYLGPRGCGNFSEHSIRGGSFTSTRSYAKHGNSGVLLNPFAVVVGFVFANGLASPPPGFGVHRFGFGPFSLPVSL